MKSLFEKRYLLVDGSEPDSETRHQPRFRRSWIASYGLPLSLLMALLISTSYNLKLSTALQKEKHRPDHCRSNYTGLAYDTPKTYMSSWGKNKTEADDYWESLDASPVVVALDYKEAAQQYGLGESAPFPWDNEKGLYYIKAFHHIHCLKIMRKAFKSWSENGTWIGSRPHLDHCLNTLLQDVMCKPDDTIMTTGNMPNVIGDNQTVWCRNWDALVDWSLDLRRNACYKVFEDDAPVLHSLELYAYCPPESPYYSTMKAYFEKHAHRPMFGNHFADED